MTVIDINPLQLSFAFVLVIILSFCAFAARLGITKKLLISAIRTIVQLSLIGLVLEALFSTSSPFWISMMALAMLLIAGREVTARQRRRLTKGWSFAIGTTSMFVSSFTVAILTLTVIINPHPWFTPQYAIPLLGMMLGNTMNGVAICLDRLHETTWQQRRVIENRLMLGHPWNEAIGKIRRDAVRAGMIPAINAMAAAGVVSLPGMMTGQILAGTSPALAVKYQILIMLMITVGSGFGSMISVLLASRRLFDQRERLRIDRLVLNDPD
ncbi:iron export ABC transporter permease subunit FetB [Hahella sp. CCB-MM4]|nr:iron export ABC transporter permease subunit FetB [Hahella sp. CCB-MM4]